MRWNSVNRFFYSLKHCKILDIANLSLLSSTRDQRIYPKIEIATSTTNLSSSECGRSVCNIYMVTTLEPCHFTGTFGCCLVRSDGKV